MCVCAYVFISVYVYIVFIYFECLKLMLYLSIIVMCDCVYFIFLKNECLFCNEIRFWLILTFVYVLVKWESYVVSSDKFVRQCCVFAYFAIKVYFSVFFFYLETMK